MNEVKKIENAMIVTIDGYILICRTINQAIKIARQYRRELGTFKYASVAIPSKEVARISFTNQNKAKVWEPAKGKGMPFGSEIVDERLTFTVNQF